MAANKVAGVRAALCADPLAAEAARVWNHANVLCLSNRSLSGPRADDLAMAILVAWLDTSPGDQGADGVARLAAVDARHRAR
jgi:ribose 5-phosphate isomerase B